eukprot:TRINITY_DN30149_c0_g1_i2.p1 TRINITY_DN30149_c0_g1~~TRINITY_DN30149_c0_g1_i2.p1  ORF type:complete len:261 (-),score=27.99 TRINITY_DN30149_c0_g1_i2:105-887(-)
MGCCGKHALFVLSFAYFLLPSVVDMARRSDEQCEAVNATAHSEDEQVFVDACGHISDAVKNMVREPDLLWYDCNDLTFAQLSTKVRGFLRLGGYIALYGRYTNNDQVMKHLLYRHGYAALLKTMHKEDTFNAMENLDKNNNPQAYEAFVKFHTHDHMVSANAHVYDNDNGCTALWEGIDACRVALSDKLAGNEKIHQYLQDAGVQEGNQDCAKPKEQVNEMEQLKCFSRDLRWAEAADEHKGPTNGGAVNSEALAKSAQE